LRKTIVQGALRAPARHHVSSEAPNAKPGKVPLPKEVSFAGCVLDADGHPIEGAKLTLAYDRFREGNVEQHFHMLGRSAADGRFRFTVHPSDLEGFTNLRGSLPIFTFVFATADGYGPVCALTPFGPTPPRFVHQPLHALDFRLPLDRVPIVGEIVAADGRPIFGVVVEAVQLYSRQEPDGTPRSLESGEAKVSYPNETAYFNVAGLIASVTTDAHGRFRLAGFGQERIVGLNLKAPGRKPVWIEVATRQRRTSHPERLDDGFHQERRRAAFYQIASFTHRMPETPDFRSAQQALGR
jgi:hypothetical protein